MNAAAEPGNTRRVTLARLNLPQPSAVPEILAIALLSGPDPAAWKVLRRANLGHLLMEGTRYLAAKAGPAH